MVYYQGERYSGYGEFPFSFDDYPNLRGVIDFNTNSEEIMADAGVVEVASAVAGLTGGVVAPYEVADGELERADQYYSVFRLKGVGWTYIHPHSNRKVTSFLDLLDNNKSGQLDLASLSAGLGARMIQIGVSDTAGAVGYSFYDRGVLREVLDAADGEVFRFESTDRQVDFEDVDFEEFTDQFLLSHDALLAGAGFSSYGDKALKPATLPVKFELARFVIVAPGGAAAAPPKPKARSKVKSPRPKAASPKPKNKSPKPKN